MKNKIRYCTLAYYPSFLLTDNSTIAILFHNLTTNERKFEVTSNLTRITSLYDDLDGEMFKLILMSIKESSCSDAYQFENTTTFDLGSFTRYYVNEFKFSPIIEVETENFEEFIAEARRIYLRFDYDKASRPTSTDEIKFLRHIIKSDNLEANQKPIIGTFDDKIQFDYIINNEFAIKIFNFKDKKLNKAISAARNWALIAQEVSNKYKVIYIYSIDLTCLNDAEKCKFNTVLDILKRYGYKTYEVNEGFTFIAELAKSAPQQVLFKTVAAN